MIFLFHFKKRDKNESFLFTIGDGQMFEDVQNDKSLWEN